MDLNIGTAFWFASRGIGTLRQYTAEEYQQMYHFEENGRPLLRLGEEGARRGKGQKDKQCQSENNSATNKKLFCSREKCRKVSKVGCIKRFCRSCCERDQQEAREGMTTGRGAEERVDVCDVCPVHRLKKFEPKVVESEIPVVVDEGAQDDQGLKTEQQQLPPYRSTCKILLVGIGADEQMAGYGRHRTTFEKLGWDGLVNELHSDMTRLWTRNLGR
jgi:hypothetical protein